MSRLKILCVFKQKKNVDTFAGTIRALLARGHSVTLCVQEAHSLSDDRLSGDIQGTEFSIVRGPAARGDEWTATAPLLRSLHDCVHYLHPRLRQAEKLQRRSLSKLGEDLDIGEAAAAADAVRSIPLAQIARLGAILDLAEQSLPADPLWMSFIAEQSPDVVLLSPVVHFGSAQADVVAAAQQVGVPTGMLLFSWDNLSTKGRLHRKPDWLFVWNRRQQAEAEELHGFPPDRVAVVGAPRFDAFFDKRPQLTRETFHEGLGLDPLRPTFLYVCSSQFVSAAELPFVRKWIHAIRQAASDPLRACNIIVRPHPDIDLLPQDAPVASVRWPDSGIKGYVSRPFADDRSIVLRTSDRLMQGLYESIAHSTAVVGLNTSAELEAAIVGRPVYTILAEDEDADGQRGSVHFHYLLEERGGFVKVARNLTEHVHMLETELRQPTDEAVLHRFVSEFLRPLGMNRAVAPLLAESIEHAFAEAAPQHRGHASEEDAGSAGKASPPATAVSVPLAGVSAGLRLFTFSEPEGVVRSRYKTDPTTTEWLRDHVAIGDVLYDIGAGIGAYSVIAASSRGSVVIAFEPGYAAFKLLCENLRLNGCAGSVIPLPIALADAEGMAELKYAPARPGQHRHVVRQEPWRVKRARADERAFVQPVPATTLDAVVERYALPLPNHIRFGEHADVSAVLRGAVRLFRSDGLKTIFATVQEEQFDELAKTFRLHGWVVGLHKPISRGRIHVVLIGADRPAGARHEGVVVRE